MSEDRSIECMRLLRGKSLSAPVLSTPVVYSTGVQAFHRLPAAEMQRLIRTRYSYLCEAFDRTLPGTMGIGNCWLVYPEHRGASQSYAARLWKEWRKQLGTNSLQGHYTPEPFDVQGALLRKYDISTSTRLEDALSWRPHL